MKITIRMTAVLCAIGAPSAALPTTFAAEKSARMGPLASLPTMPGPHIDKIKALADNAWLARYTGRGSQVGQGTRSIVGFRLPLCADLNAAFLCGEGIHGWYNKQTNRYMDDLWAYDVNGHRWICLHPGTDIKNIYLKMSADGFEVDETGQPIPVAQMGHGFAMVTYDTDRNKFMFMPCPVGNYLPLFGERRKAWGGYKWPLCPVDCSPWMYNASTGQFEIAKIKGVLAGGRQRQQNWCGRLCPRHPADVLMGWRHGCMALRSEEKCLDQYQAHWAEAAIRHRRQRLSRYQARPDLPGRRLLSRCWSGKKRFLVLRREDECLGRSATQREGVCRLQSLRPKSGAHALRFGQ